MDQRGVPFARDTDPGLSAPEPHLQSEARVGTFHPDNKPLVERKKALGREGEQGKLDKPQWAAFLRGWEPLSRRTPWSSSPPSTKKQKVNYADLVKGL